MFDLTFSFFFLKEFLFSNYSFAGFVLGKKNLGKRKSSDMSEGNSNRWEVNAKFHNVTYWNHDILPSHDDAFLRSFHWLSVAKVVSFCSIPIVEMEHLTRR
jgi:hypothetical protein